METRRRKRPPLSERLLKGLREANEWARGERDDLRVTTLIIPDDEPAQPAAEARPKPRKSAGQ